MIQNQFWTLFHYHSLYCQWKVISRWPWTVWPWPQCLRDLDFPLLSVMSPPSSSYPSILRNLMISCLYLKLKNNIKALLISHIEIIKIIRLWQKFLLLLSDGVKICWVDQYFLPNSSTLMNYTRHKIVNEFGLIICLG